MMKNKILSILTVFALVFSLTSCEDYFGDVNVDPNNPTAVTPNVLLPQIQVRLAYAYGGDASRHLSIFTQHLDGVTRQFAIYQNYGIQPNDVDNLYGGNLYSGVMMDNRQLRALADAEGYNHYSGISRAIEAYTMMLVTDWWGDVPYSEAFQGTDLLSPKYDDQADIYVEIFRLIEEAISLLSGDGGAVLPGGADLMYGGDADAWVKFCRTLKARGYLHLSKLDNANYQNVLDNLADGFASRDDDGRITFGSTPSSTAPWYQYIEQRDDAEVGVNYVALMNSLNDPRVDVYGVPLDVPGHPVFVRNQAQPLLTYVEAKFMEAEAEMMVNGAAAAHQPYLDAIMASFSDAGLDSEYAAYVGQTEIDPGSGNLTLDHIMTQKYIAMFMDPEVLRDWRRTGIPELDPNTGANVPRRLPYAETAVLYNENTPSPADVTIYDRVDWDVE